MIFPASLLIKVFGRMFIENMIHLRIQNRAPNRLGRSQAQPMGSIVFGEKTMGWADRISNKIQSFKNVAFFEVPFKKFPLIFKLIKTFLQ
jgi:adenylosuccinate lyase